MEESEDYGPEFEVWNHLSSGLDLARMELDALDKQTRQSVEGLAKIIIQNRSSFSHPPALKEWIAFFDGLLDDPWFRFAAELELADAGVDRASGALRRYLELRPVFSEYQVGSKATLYLREVVDTFLFGFDAACIALCGAALEQVLRELAVEFGEYSEARLNRERPTGHTLLEVGKRSGCISSSAFDAAKRVLEQRNYVMHRSLWEERIIKSMAVQSITDLGKVLTLLDPTPGA